MSTFFLSFLPPVHCASTFMETTETSDPKKKTKKGEEITSQSSCPKNGIDSFSTFPTILITSKWNYDDRHTFGRSLRMAPAGQKRLRPDRPEVFLWKKKTTRSPARGVHSVNAGSTWQNVGRKLTNLNRNVALSKSFCP